MNANKQATKLLDASERFLKCREDYSTDEEFNLVLDLGMRLRTLWLWDKLSVSDRIVSIKNYKKIVKHMAKAGVENSYLYNDVRGIEIKRIVNRLAEIWSKK